MPKLTRQEKQLELERHRDILLATIDYVLRGIESENLTEEAFATFYAYYQQQKKQIEKYFQERRLITMKQRLNSLIMMGPLGRVDVTFNDYIKQTTGHEIDIFENLLIRVKKIIAQHKITDKKQLNDIAIMFELGKQEPSYSSATDTLKKIVIEYANEAKKKKAAI
ncbi:MAG: hypothetical protein JST75_20940 [Bacteroidetes bacterium]|nr:hypothetical protein [Bacteroidota bacterium]